MKIFVTKGEGHGKTLLSAFDASLKDAGIYNYNLLVLSSIIPAHSIIKKEKFHSKPEDYGDRLYVVKAEARSRETGKFVGAGLGWYQLADGRGVFVEHFCESEETYEAVESTLKQEIKKTLTDLCLFRDYPVDETKMMMEIQIAEVQNEATCVLVVAAYQSEGWR